MTRTSLQPFENPWLSQFDTIERKLINCWPTSRRTTSVEMIPHIWIQCGGRAEQALQQLAQNPDDLLRRANGWLAAGWLTRQGMDYIRQLQQLGEALQISTRTDKHSAQLEEYQRLVGQLMPTLERINQRLHAQSAAPLQPGSEDSVEVALRVAMKRRAPLFK